MVNVQFIKLLVLVFYINYTEATGCSKQFEEYMKPLCESLYINSTHSCHLSHGQCDLKPNSCDLYAGKEESICNAIILPDNYKKCSIINNKCSETKKSCSDYNEETDEIPCELLYAGDNARCILKNGQCQAHYNNCENFTSDDEIKCIRNIPSIDSHKCIWENNKCKEVNKGCEDYSENCEKYTVSDINKICIFSSSGCKEQYKTCELYNQNALNKNKADCESIEIYDDKLKRFNNSLKCSFENGECSSRDKQCSDFLKERECTSFIPKDTKKICLYSGNKCKEQYKNCILYENNALNKNADDCESIKIYNDETRNFVNSPFCYFSNGRCSTTSTGNEECSDFSGKSDYYCFHFKPQNTDKMCVYIDKQCKEQYKTCELYDRRVSDKNKDDCESIILYDEEMAYGVETNYKCAFIDGKCSTIIKNCSEIYDSYNCHKTNPADQNKKCIFLFDEDICEEQFKTCELYDKEAIKTKEICEKILPYEIDGDNLDNDSKCVFENSHCVRKKKECSDFDKQYNCKQFRLDDENKICVFENGKCKEQYKSCSLYNNDINKNEEGCKAIKYYILYSDGSVGNIDYRKFCVYENNVCKDKEIKTCEDYESWLDEKYCTTKYFDSFYKRCIIKDNKCITDYTKCPGTRENVSREVCQSIILSYLHQYSCQLNEESETLYCNYGEWHPYSYKKCFIENGKCVEKYIFCSDYSGNNKEYCESIIPHKDYNTSLELTFKCVMGKSGCEMVPRNCSEAKTREECMNKILAYGIKCSYEDNECKTLYTDCSSYNSYIGDNIDRSICESIELEDHSSKCVFRRMFDRYYCIEIKKECSEISRDYRHEQVCLSLTPSSFENYCDYNRQFCEEKKKSCLELATDSRVTESICSSAPTSAGIKKCYLKEDNSGCEEKDYDYEGKNLGSFCLKFKFSLLFLIFWFFN